MRNFVRGARTLGEGFGALLRAPRLLLLGAVPAVLSAVLLLGALIGVVWVSGDIASWLTPFAADWAEVWRTVVRVLVAVLLVAAAGFVGTLVFIALTLLIGGPFYEYIAEKTEERLGLDTVGDGASATRQLGRGARDSGKLVLIAAAGGIVLFVLGFVPVVGQLAALSLGVLFGAWIIALEVVGPVFQRTTMSLAQRHRILRGHRGHVLGFGLPTYLLCLIPVAQLVVIPSAVVGGTLLAHRVLEYEPEQGPVVR